MNFAKLLIVLVISGLAACGAEEKPQMSISGNNPSLPSRVNGTLAFDSVDAYISISNDNKQCSAEVDGEVIEGEIADGYCFLGFDGLEYRGGAVTNFYFHYFTHNTYLWTADHVYYCRFESGVVGCG
jgi:hypothetical protein